MEKANFLVKQILKEDSARSLFSITGMGGVGKTTLARGIYNHVDVVNAFPSRAWVCVSERYNFRDVMKRILKQLDSVPDELLEGLQESDLEEKLHARLQGRRYLVVLDDVWQEQGWEILSRVFPDDSNGNRLLLTSRKKSVAQHANPLRDPFELQTLGIEEGWLLFIKRAFADGQCPSHLEDVGRRIVAECGGLPLAIVTIGSLLLQKKRLRREWEIVLRDITCHLLRGRNGVSTILELSYLDLPPELKFCFKYLGLFPEDHKISVKRLVNLWVAEGIACRSNGSRCLEDIAMDYVEQLLNRNMLQAARTSVDDRVKTCRLHDLLRDLAIKKSEDDSFLDVIVSGKIDNQTSMRSRYVAVHDDAPFPINCSPHLRTILFFGMDTFGFRRTRLLRVLDFEGLTIAALPKVIGILSLLRYLGLRGTHVSKLPRSISQLLRLVTLDVFTNGISVEIPNVIWKLECLRHIYVWDLSSDAPVKISGLKCLRMLSSIDCGHVMRSDVMTLTCLQKLGIWIDPNSDIDKLCMVLSQLGSPRSLNLYARDGTFPSLNGISSISHISELKLDGELNALPHLPPKLSRLVLDSTKLEEDPMPVLEKLEQVSFLKLDHRAYVGKKMAITKKGFYQLSFLELRGLYLEELAIEKGALPEVRCLRIRECSSLIMLPEELESMSCLQKLELVNMRNEFVSRIQGLDSYKVGAASSTVRIFHQAV